MVSFITTKWIRVKDKTFYVVRWVTNDITGMKQAILIAFGFFYEKEAWHREDEFSFFQ